MPYKHNTVPIGGAPFVPPFSSLYDGNGESCAESSYASSSSRSSSISFPCSSSTSSSSSSTSSSSSPPPSSARASSSNLDAPHSYPLSAPPSTSSSSPPSPRQLAAFDYSRRLHQHTASMWQTERQNIEKAKLHSPGISPCHRQRPINTGYIRGPPSPPTPCPSVLQQQNTVAQWTQDSTTTSTDHTGSAIEVFLGRTWGRRRNNNNNNNNHRHQRNKTVS